MSVDHVRSGRVTRVHRKALVVSAWLLLGMGLAGCSTRAREHDASEVAARFVAAVSARDGAAACALLTERARESVSGATDATCADAVLNVEEDGSAVRRVEVWGDAAQVRVGTDVIFLQRLRAGWFVSAAGCEPRPSAPYNCDVDG
jgi:hypothetical protein